MNRRVFIAAAVAIFASGCNFHTTLPEADDALNQEAHSVYLDLIEARDDQLVARMSSENDLAAVRAQLPMLRDLVSHDFAPEPQVASYQKTRSTQGEFYVINQDYNYSDRVVHANTTFKREGDEWNVLGFNLNVNIRPVPPNENGEIEVVSGET